MIDKKKKNLILIFSFLCGGFIGLAVGLIYIKKLEEKNTEIEPVKSNKEIPERNDANKLLEKKEEEIKRKKEKWDKNSYKDPWEM